MFEVLFDRLLGEWRTAGGTRDFAIAPELWEAIAEHIQPGTATLEFGSGLSTWLFDAVNAAHTAIEHQAAWSWRCRTRPLSPQTTIELCPICDGWYDWQPLRPYDVVLIDGPPGSIGRAGVLNVVDQLCHDTTVLFVDDVQRDPERAIADEIVNRLNRPLATIDCNDGRRAAMI